MAKQDFIPNPDADFLTFHDQLKTAATSIGATLDITAGDLTTLGNDNTAAHAKVATANTASAAAQQATADKRTTRRAVEGRVRAFARRLKTHTNYTEALGQQLGIIGPEDSTDLATAKPTLTGTILPHGATEIGFNKSVSEGVNIYCQRGPEAAPVFLARDTSAPYVDNRPLLVANTPETRKYTAIYVLHDGEIGLTSDVLTLVCQP